MGELLEALMGRDQPSESPTVNETPAAEPVKPAEPAPEAKSEEAPAQEAPKAATSEPVAEAEAPQPSRAEKRIRQLAAKNKELAAQLDLQRQMSSLNQGLPVQPASSLEGKEEVTVQDIEARAKEIAKQMVNEALATRDAEARNKERLNAFTHNIEKAIAEFPQLNPESPEYDAEQDQFLQEFLEDSGAVNKDGQVVNPDVNVHSLASKAMKIWKSAETKGASKTTAEMARTMAQSAATPDASKEEPRTKSRLVKDFLAKGDIDAALNITFGG